MYATTDVLRGNANTGHDGETQSLIRPRASPGRGFAKYVTPLRISVLLGLGTAAVLGVSTLSPDVLVGNVQIFSTPFSKDTSALGDPAAYDGGGVSGAVSEAGPVDTSADYESPTPAASPVDTSTDYESPSPAASPLDNSTDYESLSPAASPVDNSTDYESPSPAALLVDNSTDYESPSPAASPVEISADEESPSPAASPAASPIDASADEIDNLNQKLTAFTRTFNAIKDLKNIKDMQHNFLIPNDIKDVITALSDPSDTEGLILTKEGTILDGVNGLQSVIQNEIDGDDDDDDEEGDDNGEYHGDANEEEEEEEQLDPNDPKYDEETIDDPKKSHGYGVSEKEDGDEETSGDAEVGDYSSGQTVSKVISETADDDEGDAYAEPQFPSETEEKDDEETNDNDDSGRGGGRPRRQKRQEERRARLEDRKAKRSSRRERRGQ